MKQEDKIPVGTAEDLTGKRYGQLTVLYRVKSTGKTRGAKWRCQCECGQTTDVFASNLKKGHTLSCGCLQKEKTSSIRLINEIGNKYGRLTVIERGEDYVSPTNERHVGWVCKCECGNSVTVNADSLRRGKTISCGCYRKEQVANRSRNQYIGKTFHYITILDKINKTNNNRENLWKCRCNLCNSEFILPTSRLKTQISCGCIKESYGILIIKALLDMNNIRYETEKTFEECRFEESGRKARFDFFVENQYIIEFDGQQHFSYSGGWNTKEQMLETQKRDWLKNEWCRLNNIPIIRIPYWSIDNLTIEDLKINSQFLLYQGETENE